MFAYPEDLRRLEDDARRVGLTVSAVAALDDVDGFDAAHRSIALLSPDPGAFWALFSASGEARDGRADPIDRWSLQTVRRLADQVDGVAAFPFEGPPHRPFSAWAQRAGVAWPSPSGPLVHRDHGLWISFRGAVALRSAPPAAPSAPSPCVPCARPCERACPVGALTGDGYDYAACVAHVRSAAGAACATTGCLARRACPIGRFKAPPDPQLALHMAAFAGDA